MTSLIADYFFTLSLFSLGACVWDIWLPLAWKQSQTNTYTHIRTWDFATFFLMSTYVSVCIRVCATSQTNSWRAGRSLIGSCLFFYSALCALAFCCICFVICIFTCIWLLFTLITLCFVLLPFLFLFIYLFKIFSCSFEFACMLVCVCMCLWVISNVITVFALSKHCNCYLNFFFLFLDINTSTITHTYAYTYINLTFFAFLLLSLRAYLLL